MRLAELTDIHCHILAGVDDGARDDETMFAMLTRSYEDGVRAICLTPHYEPERFGDSFEMAAEAFERAKRYVEQKLPGLSLWFGNELGYTGDATTVLRSGKCRTMGNGRYVLVDFFSLESVSTMTRAVDVLSCEGYIPILAHVERYSCLWGKLREIERLADKGALIQVNVRSLTDPRRRDHTKRTAEKLISRGLCDVIASDAHNLTNRAPGLSEGYRMVAEKFGEKCAEYVFKRNPEDILRGKTIR